jgi:serine/threonine protein kinase
MKPMPHPPKPQRANELVSDEVSRWREGHSPDAAQVLSLHPELRSHKSLVLDLAYEEYCLRRKSGEPVPPSTFCDRFPTYSKSLRRILDVHDFVEHNGGDISLDDEIAWPQTDERFLGFDILDQLGKGAFARVYLAAEPALGNRLVALKVSRQGASEAEMLGRLSHPNIVPVHSIRSDDASPRTAICMPYLGRATLCDVLDLAFADGAPPKTAEVILRAARESRALPESAELPGSPQRMRAGDNYVDTVVRIGRQLAEALAYTHAKGILHRDLKPSNILVTPAGVPKLLDFNLSADTGVVADKTGGTLPYMPPELLREVIGEMPPPATSGDARSDIFSLGVILYELLTGLLPFGEPRLNVPMHVAAEAHLARQQQGPRPLREKNAQVDPALEAVIYRCLALEPGDRPQTAAELAAELKRYLAPQRRVQRLAIRHRRSFIAAGLAAAASFTGLAAFSATRDPYDIRQYNAGLWYYDRGDYDQALPHFTQAVTTAPTNPAYLFARAQTHRQLGNLTAAEADYKQAAEHSPQGIIRACVGYCFSQRQKNEDARFWYEQAMVAGYVEVDVRNNLGACCLKLGLLLQAIENLDEAIRLDGNSEQATYNRAVGEWWLCNQKGTRPSDFVLQKIRGQSSLGIRSADFSFIAACLFSWTALDEPAQVQTVQKYLADAVRLGVPEAQVKSIPSLLGFLDDPALKQSFTQLAIDQTKIKANPWIAPPMHARLR